MELYEYPASCNICRSSIEISTELFFCRIFWAKVISSESESLLTQYTKHTFYEMQYALTGKIGLLVGEDERIDIEESHFTVIPPDTYHQIIDEEGGGARFIIAFSLEPKNNEIEKALKGFLNICSFEETQAMRAVLSLMMANRLLRDDIERKMLSSLAEMMILEIIKRVYEKDKEPGTVQECTESDVADEVASYIVSRAGVGISTESVAERFNYSTRHLNRIMLSKRGRTVGDIIAHEKLKKIEEYSVSTSLTLYEIAELCGFSDAYAMNKFFKRYNKLNLSQYRKIAKDKNNK